ncbi:MAG: sulfatase [Verrucomicrobiae bacterium]|nr:sulfatase [Verrucomicrobiae bacterium]
MLLIKYPKLLTVLLLSLCYTVSAADRPNIIYLMTDDQRADALGCMGNPIIHTPNIDRLASEAALFKNAFVTTAICMTNRACVFTGQYAARHGIWAFNTDFSKEQLGNTYLGQLKQAGYRTGFIGKWGVGHPKQADGILDYNEGFPGQSQYFEGNVKDKQGQHLTAKMGDQAIEFLKGCDDETPFLLSISFKAPHCQDSSDIYSDQFPSDPVYADLYQDVTIPMPYTAAAEFHDRLPDFIKNSMNRDRWAIRFRSPAQFQRCVKDYYRLISGVDTVVGRIREQLEKQGFADNTVIIYTSDHGFFLGEYGFAGKWTPHEVSIRIPLIIYDPRLPASKRGIQREEMTLAIDMAPTILSYAGVAAPKPMQGVSLKSLVDGAEPISWRTSFFYEHWFNANGLIVPSEGFRDQRWKYMRYLYPGKEAEGTARHEELYDLKVDPHETVNLAGEPQYQNRLQRMRNEWATWREAVK